MPDSQRLDDNTNERNMQNIQGGQGMQVNDSNAPVFQMGEHSTVNINYGNMPVTETTPTSSPGSSWQRQRLEDERQSLQEQWKISNERLAFLRRSYAFESAPATKFQLQKQIEDGESELKRLEERLQEIETSLASP